jgi:methionyl-tRNA formyltransferase
MVTPPCLRVVFFGTPAFAVPTLEALLRSSHQVVWVVTQPDRARGRGQKVRDSPVKVRALEAGLPVVQPARLKDPAFLEAFAAVRPDVGAVAAYGRILPEQVIAIPPLGLINVHASLLPKYRGAAPVHRAVMAGEPETGVTIMRIVKELDAGPMLAEARRSIGANETSSEVEGDLARTGAVLLVQALDQLARGDAIETPQDGSRATLAPRLTKDEGMIDWSRSAVDVHNLIRGLHPWPHASTSVKGQRLIVLRSRLAEAPAPPAHPGTIVAAAGDQLRVAAGSGAVDLLQVQLEGKRPMTVREFLAGHRLAVGERLGGP